VSETSKENKERERRNNVGDENEEMTINQKTPVSVGNVHRCTYLSQTLLLPLSSIYFAETKSQPNTSMLP